MFTTEALNRSTRFISNAHLEAIEATTRLGPIADTDPTLISEIEWLSSGQLRRKLEREAIRGCLLSAYG